MSIDWFFKEIHQKELTNAWLLGKASQLPQCRRNILSTKVIMWDKFITCICIELFTNPNYIPKSFSINDKVKEVLKNNVIVNNNFLEFFFAFHSTISSRFESQIKRLLTEVEDLKMKITGLIYLYKELMNLTRIELEGFEIDCEVIGNCHICSNHECKSQPNVITLMITPEYVQDERIITNIVNTLEKFIKPKTVDLVVDYRNLCDYFDRYSWEETGAYCRFLKCKKFVNNIYFYKTDCVDFGKYKKELEPYIIKSKAELKKIYRRDKNV